METKNTKIENVVELAQKLLSEGRYVISSHAQLRQEERRLSIGDLKMAIQTGEHNEKKDKYIETYKDWNYTIEGKTLDERKARICVAFQKKSNMVVVTVIDLGKKS